MRRREAPRPARVAGSTPPWVQNLTAGLRHAQEMTGKRNLGDQLPYLRRERARWCADHGCHRQGTKTCREAFGSVPESCEKAGGPAEQGEG